MFIAERGISVMNDDIQEEIAKIINKTLNPYSIKIIYLRDQPNCWDFILTNVEYIPVVYKKSSVNYYNAYMRPTVEKYVDLSMMICLNERPVGVWPLCLIFNGVDWACGSNDGAVLPPLFIKGIQNKKYKFLIDKCLGFLDELCYLTDQKKWNGKNFIVTKGIDDWHRKIMERGARLFCSHELYVDLNLSLNRIHSSIRKSYRPLIAKGSKLWQIEVHEQVNNSLFYEFRNFHRIVSGRVTRPLETWVIQEQAINQEEAILITLRDKNSNLIGGGFFEFTKSEGVYSVGVYDRSLFSLPLGHLVQMKAIEFMKEKGLKWYRIGKRHYPGDTLQPSDKELTISKFKEGFSTDVFLTLETVCPSGVI
jgi:FemAB family protein